MKQILTVTLTLIFSLISQATQEIPRSLSKFIESHKDYEKVANEDITPFKELANKSGFTIDNAHTFTRSESSITVIADKDKLLGFIVTLKITNDSLSTDGLTKLVNKVYPSDRWKTLLIKEQINMNPYEYLIFDPKLVIESQYEDELIDKISP